jgi:hypothetical protein
MPGEGRRLQDGDCFLSFDDDPTLRYPPEQLRHHETAQSLLSNPLARDAENQIWS